MTLATSKRGFGAASTAGAACGLAPGGPSRRAQFVRLVA